MAFDNPLTSEAGIPPAKLPVKRVRRQHWVEASGFVPWMETWCLWYAGLDHIPNVNEQVGALRKYSKQPCGTNALSRLKKRPDVATRLTKYLEDRVALARAIAMGEAPGHIELRKAALNQAVTEMQSAETSKERMLAARTILVGTEPTLNKVWPTKEEHAPQAPTVIINLGNPSGFAARHHIVATDVELPALPPVDYEIVKDEPGELA